MLCCEKIALYECVSCINTSTGFFFDILKKKPQFRKNSKLKRFLMKTQKPVSIIYEKKMLEKLNKSFNNLV